MHQQLVLFILLLDAVVQLNSSPSRNQARKLFRSSKKTRRDAPSRPSGFLRSLIYSDEDLDASIRDITSILIRTNSGNIKGFKKVLDNNSIKPVIQFLGIPYAAPPIGKLRWQRTEKAKPWNGVRNASEFGPICPQPRSGPLPSVLLPIWYKANNSLVRKMRMDEDCLYLNIYVPAKLYATEQNYPRNHYKNPLKVMVYFHGYTYAEGSGNFYDGSVLASYGDVIVVTFNYRLGVLGFMSTMEANSPGNYGLWDQIAAVKWVSENIEKFGGDPSAVTVFGSGAGASCIGLLMLSVQLDEYFHRAIFQSGTPLAPWSMVRNPRQQTRALARDYNINCDRESTTEMVRCLKHKHWRDLINVEIMTDPYDLVYGPVVDGQDKFLMENPFNLMEKGEFVNYQIMMGVSQADGFGYIRDRNVDVLRQPFESSSAFMSPISDRMKTNFDVVVAKFTDSFYEDSKVPLEAIEKLVRFIYTDWSDKSNPTRVKESLMDLYTDRQYVEPAVRAALHYINYKSNAFFYTFYHHPGKDKTRPWVQSALGEQDPFVFGAPLLGNSEDTLFPYNYTKDDIMISTAVMTYWTNFAKNGDPGIGKKQQTQFITGKANSFEKIVWPEYTIDTRQHLKICTTPEVSDHYRAQKVELWRSFLPSLSGVSNDESYKGGRVKPLLPPRAKPPTISPGTKTPTWQPIKNYSDILFNQRSQQQSTPKTDTSGLSLQLSITLAVGFVLLFLNIIAFAVVSYHKEKDKYKIEKLKAELKMFKKSRKSSDTRKLTSGHTTLESRLGPDPKLPEFQEKNGQVSPQPLYMHSTGGTVGNLEQARPESMYLKLESREQQKNNGAPTMSPRKGGDGAFAPKNGECLADIAFLSPQKGQHSNESDNGRESVVNYWSRSECGDDSGASGSYNPNADVEKSHKQQPQKSTRWPTIAIPDHNNRSLPAEGRCRSALPFCSRPEHEFTSPDFYAEPATLNRHTASQRRITDIERYATAPRSSGADYRQAQMERPDRRPVMDYIHNEFGQTGKPGYEYSQMPAGYSSLVYPKSHETYASVRSTSTGTYSSVTTKL
uniref:neuroligin-4, X-linked isoform X2 n=1 Tax=Ciona intestinalis TaxID=7719 RepID=UPI00089DBB87|nr:neuroligin-4, X-linked isoform X2 [Ciona intestinalis]|eukprot:XP_018668128.1 neuroligin-4, X-linked isoform X2 [Ciona intestinalis]